MHIKENIKRVLKKIEPNNNFININQYLKLNDFVFLGKLLCNKYEQIGKY